MDLAIRILQFMSSTLHTDNITILIAIIVILQILIIIQIVKKLLKLATAIILILCFIVQMQFLQEKLEQSYGITFDGTSASITVDIGTSYDSYDKQFVLSQKQQQAYVYTNGSLTASIVLDELTSVNISDSTDLQIITLEYSDGTKQEIITDSGKGKIVYMILKATGALDKAGESVKDLVLT